MTADLASVSAADFRLMMRQHAGGVSVITTGEEASRTGMTATSVASFSDAPPSVIFGLNRASSTWKALCESGWFCVNILAGEHETIARNFSGFGGLAGADRYRDGQWDRLGPGAMALRGVVGSLHCVLEDEIQRHTHSIIIGRVVTIRMSKDITPLIYWNGAYMPLHAGTFDQPAPRGPGAA
jgi:flavin reductase (DIM6/NTAB) family NADH-FMN oxidoreductase RutF